MHKAFVHLGVHSPVRLVAGTNLGVTSSTPSSAACARLVHPCTPRSAYARSTDIMLGHVPRARGRDPEPRDLHLLLSHPYLQQGPQYTLNKVF